MNLSQLPFFGRLKLTDKDGNLIPGSENLGSYLKEALSSVAQKVTNIETQGGFNASKPVAPPPNVQSLNVTAQNGHFQVAIQDQSSGVGRANQYFFEHASNPSFTDAHVVPMGQSRNAHIFLGNVTRYFRAYSALPASGPSGHVYHGGQSSPIAVSGGGPVGGPAFLPSQGSGTSAPGQAGYGPGPVPFLSDNGGFDRSLQQSRGSRGGVASGIVTPGGGGFSPSGGGGGGGGGSPTITESLIAACEYLTVAGTGNAITGTTATSYTSLSAGFLIRFVAAHTNSGATTLAVNGITAHAVTKNGTAALVGGEILIGKAYVILWDGTQYQLVGAIGPISATVLASDANGVPTPAALASGSIWQGNGSNLPAAVAVPASAVVAATNSSSQITAAALATDDIWLGVSNLPVATALRAAVGGFTPTLSFSISNTGLVYAVTGSVAYLRADGVYEITIQVTLSAIGSANGTATIAGLPANIGSQTFCAQFISLTGMASITVPSITPVGGQPQLLPTLIGATGSATTMTAANFTNSSVLVIGLIFHP